MSGNDKMTAPGTLNATSGAPSGNPYPAHAPGAQFAESDFDNWIDSLDEEVIQGEYGYEPGEFAVYPKHWRPSWLAGLTPAGAFKKALDAHSDARREADAERVRNWERIQAEDRALIGNSEARTASAVGAAPPPDVSDENPGSTP